MHEELKSKRYFVSGIVQGVGYRYFVERIAQRLGIAGYTRNLRDGRVEVYAIGGAGSLSALEHELRRGPHAASVSDVRSETTEIDPRYGDNFSIEFDT